MPRYKAADRPKTKELNLPTSLVSRVDTALQHPRTGQIGYAAWSNLVSKLLEMWLEEEVKIPRMKPNRPNLDDLLE